MNKADLALNLAKELHLSKKQGEHAINYMIDTIIEALKKGEEVTLTGFGTFSARFRSARGGVNPQSPNERIEIPSTTVAKFKAGKKLNDSLKGSR